MRTSRQREFKFTDIVRYIVAIPVGLLLFYIVGEVLLILASWSYITQLNKFLVLPIIFIKNIVLASSLYAIIPRFKRVLIIIIGGIMISLSIVTIYIYITNGTSSLASIYTMQIIIWIGIIIFVLRKFLRK